MTVLAAVAAAAAVCLLLGPAPSGRLRVRPREPDAPPGRLRGRWSVPLGLVVGATVTGGLLWGGEGAAIAFAAVLPLLTTVLLWRRQRARAAAAANAREVADACHLLVGLLRVGHVPASALRVAARDAPVLAEAAAMLEIGSPVPPVLRRLGADPGRSGLLELGTSWEVAERTGASLSATLDALADRLRARQSLANVVAAELSAPRATGRLLAVLPVAGLVLGYAFGGDPVAFLTGSLPGRASLVVGSVLGCAGVFWTERIADQGSI